MADKVKVEVVLNPMDHPGQHVTLSYVVKADEQEETSIVLNCYGTHQTTIVLPVDPHTFADKAKELYDKVWEP